MVFVSYQRPSGYENSLLFSSKSFMVSPFPFRSLICQKLILVYGEQRAQSLHFPCGYAVVPELKRRPLTLGSAGPPCRRSLSCGHDSVFGPLVSVRSMARTALTTAAVRPIGWNECPVLTSVSHVVLFRCCWIPRCLYYYFRSSVQQVFSEYPPCCAAGTVPAAGVQW